MAVVLAFRLAVVLSPVAVRVVQSGQPSTVQQVGWLGEALIKRIRDPNESDADLTTAVADASGTVASVATYTGTFEVRRLQVSFTQDSGTVGGDDVRVITFHLLKLASGSPVATWDAANFTAARDRLLAFWAARNDYYTAKTVLVKTAFYRAGPGIVPPQPPANSADHSLPGDGLATVEQMPPQVALSVTEKAGAQKNWGRFYLPAMAAANANPFGRPDTNLLTDMADALETMYEGWTADGTPAVVYLEALPERSPTAADPRHQTKGTFPARGASATTVSDLQIDDVFDVIRSRRYDRPTLRVQRALA